VTNDVFLGGKPEAMMNVVSAENYKFIILWKISRLISSKIKISIFWPYFISVGGIQERILHCPDRDVAGVVTERSSLYGTIPRLLPILTSAAAHWLTAVRQGTFGVVHIRVDISDMEDFSCWDSLL